MSKHRWIALIMLLLLNGILLACEAVVPQNQPTQPSTPPPYGQRETLPSVSLPSGYHGRIVYTFRGQPYVIDLDTGEHFSYSGDSLMIFPDWHPSGDSFATGEGRINVVDFTTGAITYLAPGLRPTWSPDGIHVLYNLGSNAPSGTIFDISTQTITHAETNSGIPIIDADWSADGQYVVFGSGGTAYGVNGSQILSIEASCLENGRCSPTQLTFSNDVMSRNQTPQWSPDRTQIVFASNRDGYYSIYVMNADGSNQRRLTDNPGGDDQPTWSPDGQYIAFRRVNASISTIYIMRPDGSEVTQLFDYPAWDPDWWMDMSD